MQYDLLLSVCLSVTKCIVAQRHILQQKCVNKWIGTQIYYFQTPYTDPGLLSSQPKI